MEKIKTIRKFVLESIYICCYAYECDFMDLCDEKPELKMMNFSLGRKIIFFFSLSKYTQMKHICNIQTEKKRFLWLHELGQCFLCIKQQHALALYIQIIIHLRNSTRLFV